MHSGWIHWLEASLLPWWHSHTLTHTWKLTSTTTVWSAVHWVVILTKHFFMESSRKSIHPNYITIWKVGINYTVVAFREVSLIGSLMTFTHSLIGCPLGQSGLRARLVGTSVVVMIWSFWNRGADDMYDSDWLCCNPNKTFLYGE